MNKFLYFSILFTILLSSCSSIYKIDERTATELSEEGNKAFKNENYRDAIKAFEKLCDWYPYNNLKVDAEFKIAESYYKLKEYDDAIDSYEKFEELHPKNEKIPYILYQISMCSYEQIDSEDRDQAATKKALNTFTRLKKEHPGNELAEKAEKKIKVCLSSLAAHELYVGEFYLKTKHYKGALNRFNNLLKDYPNTKLNTKVSKYISICKQKLRAEKTLKKVE